MFDQATHNSGSYAQEDVIFLLKQVELAPTGVAEKERMIQTGAAHYSEMISEERRPDARYLAIFEEARSRGNARIAREVIGMALSIEAKIQSGELPEEITLCSLVRAGVPFGILLHRELKALGISSTHYGVSIIRDKGLDEVALRHIVDRHLASGIIFVDGWTGKGAISNELAKSWKSFSGRDPFFAVLADPSGYATMSGSHDDWLIPSGILGANVSGLISRSILNKDLIGPGDLHGYIHVGHLSDIDVSRDFVDQITLIAHKMRGSLTASATSSERCLSLRSDADASIQTIAKMHNVENVNRIKPGIAEATRAVLRRKPERVFLRSNDDPDLSALIHLCRMDGIPIEVSEELTGPYRAITLIGKVS